VTDFRRRLPRFQQGALEENLAIVECVEAVARRHDVTPAQIAMAWLLAQGEHVIPIPGTRRLAHLVENGGAADLELSPQEMAELADPPTPVGSRY
jgi:aryl-alcohol dehydrogenase-like predicted oxidoreductase